jgi:hypothetical protein
VRVTKLPTILRSGVGVSRQPAADSRQPTPIPLRKFRLIWAQTMSSKLLSCPGCQKQIATVDYKMWGTKRFAPKTGAYEEDESPGNCDLVFTCPHCDATLDPDLVLA